MEEAPWKEKDQWSAAEDLTEEDLGIGYVQEKGSLHTPKQQKSIFLLRPGQWPSVLLLPEFYEPLFLLKKEPLHSEEKKIGKEKFLNAPTAEDFQYLEQ